jgi:hypothetical protein
MKKREEKEKKRQKMSNKATAMQAWVQNPGKAGSLSFSLFRLLFGILLLSLSLCLFLEGWLTD